MQRPARVLREYLLLDWLPAFLRVICLGFSVVALLLNPLLLWSRGKAAGRCGITAGLRMSSSALLLAGAYRPDLHALDALHGVPALIPAPNHLCMIDALPILGRHSNVVCVMKAELMRNIFSGSGSR